MIGSVHTSDYSGYVPLIRGGGEQPACDCGQPGCQCAASAGQQKPADPSQIGGAGNEKSTETEKPVVGALSTSAKVQLNEAELAMVRELKQRDRKVRQHEMAHMAASGGLAQGGPNYTYQRGPDGQNYAVGGHVNLDISPGKTPAETLQKAQTIRTAAMAPAEPSGQDRAIAAKATQMEMKAQMELVQQQAAERSQQARRDDDSPAGRLAQRIFSAIAPHAEPFLQVAI